MRGPTCTPSSMPWPTRSLAMASTTAPVDRKSTRLNSSHVRISYAVFCLKKKIKQPNLYTCDFTGLDALHLTHFACVLVVFYPALLGNTMLHTHTLLNCPLPQKFSPRDNP